MAPANNVQAIARDALGDAVAAGGGCGGGEVVEVPARAAGVGPTIRAGRDGFEGGGGGHGWRSTIGVVQPVGERLRPADAEDLELGRNLGGSEFDGAGKAREHGRTAFGDPVPKGRGTVIEGEHGDFDELEGGAHGDREREADLVDGDGGRGAGRGGARADGDGSEGDSHDPGERGQPAAGGATHRASVALLAGAAPIRRGRWETVGKFTQPSPGGG